MGNSPSAWFNSSRYLIKRIIERIIASKEVAAKLSQMPVSPSGQSTTISNSGKIKAVETEISEAGTGFSIASIKLCIAKENHLVI